MQNMSRGEGLLMGGLLVALATAIWGPFVPQHDHYHAFADQRSWLGLPFGLDVLTNLPFLVAGVLGLYRSAAVQRAGGRNVRMGLAQVFFAGLVLTFAGSSYYHLQPDNSGLAWDRAGMVAAFAGLLGMAVADRISARAGLAMVGVVMVAGVASIGYWATTANLLPWAVVQGGGMLLVLALLLRPPVAQAWHLPLGAVIGFYAVAKLFELGDHAVFAATNGLISGHSLKHLFASAAAWPLLSVMHNVAYRTEQAKPNARHAMSQADHPNQFALLKQRRFAPFFWTQFSGAANDNLFKFAFTVMVTYQLSVDWLPPTMAGLVIGALFILPFLLFSATSGQLTDKYDKTLMIRFVKNLEIVVMLLAAIGFIASSVPVLLVCTFLMGVHSTLFGPVKFAYLPQVLSERELTGGNGMVEMGTFVAILLGQVAGGLLVAMPEVGHRDVAIACVVLAVVGRVIAGGIPAAPATDPTLKINWNPVSETWRNLKLAHGNLVVFRSLLGISWMWFFGAVFLSQFPSLAKEVLHGDERVASFLLVIFSIGIGTGSLLCEVLSKRHVEIGLVPLGAIGMSVFSIDLYFALNHLAPAESMGVGTFIAQTPHWRVMADLLLLSLFAGLYSVPMYALIQLRSQPTHRARIIAANNILNALFMIGSSVIAGALLSSGFTIPQIFLFTGLANAVVAFYIFMLVPEYFLRFVAWVLSRCVYRFKVQGDAHIPTQGAAILVCNHVSFVDAVLLMAASPRPIVFIMDHRIFKVPVLGWMFRLAKAIPIAPRAEDAQAYEAALDAAARVLQGGDLLCIFPEGGITKDGTLQEFKGGIIKILQRASAAGLDVPVVPMALTNLWGSFFSRVEQGGAMVRPFRRGLFNRVGLNVGPAVLGDSVSPQALRHGVQQLLSADS